MEERIARQLRDIGLVTGETILKALWAIIEGGKDAFVNYIESRHFNGATNWNKFMATSSEKSIIEFYKNEVNLHQLKDYLETKNIGFAFSKSPNGNYLLAFEAKNQSVVKDAYDQLLNDLVSDPKLKDKMIKSLSNQSLEEKLEHYQVKIKELMTSKDKLVDLSSIKQTDKEVSLE